MAGNITRVYTFSAPMVLPFFAKVKFIKAGLVIKELTEQIAVYGAHNFTWFSGTLDDATGITTEILFQDGVNWSAATFQKVAPLAGVHYPIVFSGWKIGWR